MGSRSARSRSRSREAATSSTRSGGRSYGSRSWCHACREALRSILMFCCGLFGGFVLWVVCVYVRVCVCSTSGNCLVQDTVRTGVLPQLPLFFLCCRATALIRLVCVLGQALLVLVLVLALPLSGGVPYAFLRRRTSSPLPFSFAPLTPYAAIPLPPPICRVSRRWYLLLQLGLLLCHYLSSSFFFF